MVELELNQLTHMPSDTIATHVERLQDQAKPPSNTPLVDDFIDRAAREMAKQEWPLWDIEPSEADLKTARELLEKANAKFKTS